MVQVRLMILIGGLVIAPSTALADTEGRSIEVDEQKVAQWNKFSRQVQQLHHQLIAEEPVLKQVRTGGYRGEYFDRPEFYREETYHSAASKLLLSRVKWELDNPGNVHTLELFRYDEKKRVSRDYLVAYLPWGRNAPIQALVNLHAYNKGTHSFRQFDASGVLVYERCSGELNGNSVEISLEPHEMVPPQTTSADYTACFAGLPGEVGEYLVPK